MNRTPPEDVDSDLEDLLGDANENKSNNSLKGTAGVKKGGLSNYYDDPNYYRRPQKYSIIYRIPELLCYYFMQFLICCPSVGKLLIFSALAAIIYSLLTLTAPTQSIGKIQYDFKSVGVKSQYDFDIGKIDHWCITGGDECPCPDPLHPQPRMHKAWFRAVERHKQKIGQNPDADVVFLGQSVVEVMNGYVGGNDMKNEVGEYFGRVNHMFNKRFGPENALGAKNEGDYVKGIAMGLTGDTFSNVLWRLMNGELPDFFDPPIWWLVLGMEDIGRYGCSEEITVMGVMRIVEEIKKQRPHARIVINSLLPMMTMRQEVDVDSERVQNVKIEYKDVDERPKWNEKKKNKMKQIMNNKNKDDDERVRRLKGGNGHGNRAEEKRKKREERKREREHAKIAQKEAKLDARREKKYVKEIHHDEYNPTMKIKEKFRRQRGEKGRMHVPVWTAVHEINRELHEFCNRNDGVNFFDATPLFAQQIDHGDYTLLTDYITVRGHPTPEGFKIWLDEVVKQAREWKIKGGKNKIIVRPNDGDYDDGSDDPDDSEDSEDNEEEPEGDDYSEGDEVDDGNGGEGEEFEEGDDNEVEGDHEGEEADDDGAEEGDDNEVEGDDHEGDDDEGKEAEEGDDNEVEGDDNEGEEEEADGDDGEEAEEGDDDEAEEGDDDEAEEGDDNEAETEADDDEGDENEAEEVTEEGDGDEAEEGDDDEAEEGDDNEAKDGDVDAAAEEGGDDER